MWTLSSDFTPAVIGLNAVTRAAWNSRGLKSGYSTFLLGRRAKAMVSFAIGVGEVLPGCQDQGTYRTVQGGNERCTFGQQDSSYVKELTPTGKIYYLKGGLFT